MNFPKTVATAVAVACLSSGCKATAQETPTLESLKLAHGVAIEALGEPQKKLEKLIEAAKKAGDLRVERRRKLEELGPLKGLALGHEFFVAIK